MGALGPRFLLLLLDASFASLLLFQSPWRYPVGTLEHGIGVVLYLIGSIGIAILCEAVRTSQVRANNAEVAERNQRE